MNAAPSLVRPSPFTASQWLVVCTAALGFAFDTYELLLLPLVLAPALADLGGLALGSPEFARWRSLMFFVPAVAGGVFGLLGGYLTDRLGRRRVLLWSILLYGFATGASAFATSLPMLFALRCATYVGVCVEFAAAVAWLAELFPEPKRREAVLGYTQAFSSLGGLLAGFMFALVAKHGALLPPIYGTHEAWRYALLSGLIPALLLLAVRTWLPESPEWQRRRREGTLMRPRIAALFEPQHLRATVSCAVIFGCAIGGAITLQQLPQIIPGIPEAAALPRPRQQQIAGEVQAVQEIGGLAGRAALAMLVVGLGSRPALLRLFQAPALIIVPLLFVYPALQTVLLLKAAVFLAGFLIIAQLSFLGNYLPRVYPVHLRGTGASFAANVGGRMFGTSAALLISQLVYAMPGTTPSTQLAYAAASVAALVGAAGLVAGFFLPEPKALTDEPETPGAG